MLLINVYVCVRVCECLGEYVGAYTYPRPGSHSPEILFNVSQCVAMRCNVLQRVATCCNTLQRVATCCNVLQCCARCCNVEQCVAMWCGVLQCVAASCSVLQRVAVYCIWAHSRDIFQRGSATDIGAAEVEARTSIGCCIVAHLFPRISPRIKGSSAEQNV